MMTAGDRERVASGAVNPGQREVMDRVASDIYPARQLILDLKCKLQSEYGLYGDAIDTPPTPTLGYRPFVYNLFHQLAQITFKMNQLNRVRKC